MCDIWEKNKDEIKELSLEQIRNLFFSFHLRHLKHITLTGGEPFMHKNFLEIYYLICSLRPESDFIISSNGTPTDSIIDFLREVNNHKKIKLEISLFGKGCHDSVTQSEGAFKICERTILTIKKDFPDLRLGIKFVITPWNYSEIEGMADYCSQQRLPLIIKVNENVKTYTNSVKFEENLQKNKFAFSGEQKDRILESLNKIKNKSMVDKELVRYLIMFFAREEIKKICYVPYASLFINSDGNVYRCRMGKPIGNINEQELDSLLNNDNPSLVFRNGDSCKDCCSVLRFFI
jgi:MoaA/NifB/PqqE/SkfB family radical SAM enzyme